MRLSDVGSGRWSALFNDDEYILKAVSHKFYLFSWITYFTFISYCRDSHM